MRTDRVTLVGLCFLQPHELRSRDEALDYLEDEFTKTLRALVDTLDGLDKREALGSMLEDLADLAETLAYFLGEPNPRPMRFLEPEESMEYVPALRKAVKGVERNEGALPSSLPLLFEVWRRAKQFRGREDAARAMAARPSVQEA